MKQIKLIIIGIGPHAKRVYIPSLLRLRDKYNIDIRLVVELENKEQETKDFFKSTTFEPELLFTKPFFGKFPVKLNSTLARIVSTENIDGVIIATEPLVHRNYADWALKAKLNILMDKPISTRKNVVSSTGQAKGIVNDYLELKNSYDKLQKTKDTLFSINVQRRYHPGFQYVIEELSRVAKETNCPITSINSSHCDGQWRFPTEIVTQDYHPYNEGYGKASHSGYHLFDAVFQFYKVSKITNKFADQMSVLTSFVQPRGFLQQLNEHDYEKCFGQEYETVKKYSDKELFSIFKNYGEIDVAALVSLKKGNENIANITINLMHNGFARRNWIKPGSDLYKGNGRVKHEYHSIEQGPFQNIQIHSYQSSDQHDHNDSKDYLTGGNSHFDINIFRNIGMLGGSKPLEIVRMNDLARNEGFDDSKLATEQAKEKVVVEFLDFICGRINKDKALSNIDDHFPSVQLMSSVYESNIRKIEGKNPEVVKDLNI